MSNTNVPSRHPRESVELTEPDLIRQAHSAGSYGTRLLDGVGEDPGRAIDNGVDNVEENTTTSTQQEGGQNGRRAKGKVGNRSEYCLRRQQHQHHCRSKDKEGKHHRCESARKITTTREDTVCHAQ